MNLQEVTGRAASGKHKFSPKNDFYLLSAYNSISLFAQVDRLFAQFDRSGSDWTGCMDYDISSILEQWHHKPGEVTVRRITGSDGRAKIQMRLDLGLLQMEVDGRPDGHKPHGCESLLAYHQGRLDSYRERNGVEVGFELSRSQCKALREEAVMYYYRYLSLFIIGQYQQVVRDTNRNIEVLDICRKFAARKVDRFALEQYRPYVVMMHTRAQVQLAVDDDKLGQALHICHQGVNHITEFFEQMDKPELIEHCSELAILETLHDDISTKLPSDPAKALHDDLDKALKEEHYEKAAELRDKLRNLHDCNSKHPKQQSDN